MLLRYASGTSDDDAIPFAMRCAAEKLPSDANASIIPFACDTGASAVVFAVVPFLPASDSIYAASPKLKSDSPSAQSGSVMVCAF
jgi:hypothetical protein